MCVVAKGVAGKVEAEGKRAGITVFRIRHKKKIKGKGRERRLSI